MEYALTPLFQPSGDRISLSGDRYREIAQAKDALVTTIGIEQKFDLLLENYVEYENELLTLALRQVAFNSFQWSTLQGENLTVIRRLVNLLSAARLYLDQVSHDLNEIFGEDHDLIRAITRTRSAQYDLTLGYRLLEALRNALQHQSMSGIQLRRNFGLDNDAHTRRVVTRVSPFLIVSDWRDSSLKATVRSEIVARGRDVDLTLCVREYVDGLAVVHSEFRKGAASERQAWESIIREAHRIGCDRWPKEGLQAFNLISTDESGAEKEFRHIFLEPIEYLSALETKNQRRLAFTRTYVSGSSIPDAPSDIEPPAD